MYMLPSDCWDILSCCALWNWGGDTLLYLPSQYCRRPLVLPLRASTSGQTEAARASLAVPLPHRLTAALEKICPQFPVKPWYNLPQFNNLGISNCQVREQCNKMNSVQLEYLRLKGLRVIGSLIMKLQNYADSDLVGMQNLKLLDEFVAPWRGIFVCQLMISTFWSVRKDNPFNFGSKIVSGDAMEVFNR